MIATHADDALRLLSDADLRERDALGGFEYSTNRSCSTPTSVLPGRAGMGLVERRQADCRPPADA